MGSYDSARTTRGRPYHPTVWRRAIRFFLLTKRDVFWISIILLQWFFFRQKSSTDLTTQPIVVHQSEKPVVVKNETNTLYGHIHIAKTGGSAINLKLIVLYERVCGNKGYSYDALRKNYGTDSHSMSYPKYSRGFVPWPIIKEIGFDDCDYVTLEESWNVWPDNFGAWPFPVELHLPCRDPIDHLMSQCNYRGIKLDCNASNWKEQVQSCLVAQDRFSKELYQRFPVKCYNAKNVDGYVDFMGKLLQRRRIVDKDKYATSVSNQHRSRDTECIWKQPQLQKNIENYLIQSLDYYDFCVNKCMGTKDELHLPPRTLGS